MSNSNSQSEMTSTGNVPGEGRGEMAVQHKFDLPSDVRTLAAMRVAIDEKITELKTAGAETLRSMILQESALLDMSPEEIISGTATKKRGRKTKSKHE